jgi:hypothetical protein
VARQDGGARPDDASALFGRLRGLRARAQSLRELALRLQRHATHPATHDREPPAAVEEDAASFDHVAGQTAAVVAEVSELLERNASLYDDWGDVIARVQTTWEETARQWEHLGKGHARDRSHQLTRIVEALDSIVEDCGLVTIPSRILDQLKLLPIGGALDFRSSYADELPTAEQRKRFLRYLSQYPGCLYGLIDVDGERILRASPKAWRRALTLPAAVALALAGFGLIWLACYLGDVTRLADWPFNGRRLGEHLTGYAFLLLGSLAHVAINLLKQDRAASRSTQALSDWILRIHVKETSYYLSAASLWLGALAMAFMFKDRVDWKTAFFVGYSYDSFIDLFLQRFDKAVAASQAKIKQAAAVTAPGARRRRG